MSAPITADDHLRSFVERISRIKDEQEDLGSDIRDIYAEAKSYGFDKGALGRLVTYIRKREKDGAALRESDALFELYLAAYDRVEEKVPSRTRVRTRVKPVESAFPQTTGALDEDATLADMGRASEAQNTHRSGRDTGGDASGEADRPLVSEVGGRMGVVPAEDADTKASGNSHHQAARSGDDLEPPEIPLDLIKDPERRELERIRRKKYIDLTDEELGKLPPKELRWALDALAAARNAA